MLKPKLLFFVEGFTDIRFVAGLSEVADLTLCVPRGAYVNSGLKARVKEAALQLHCHEIDGGRLAFQFRSMAWLWNNIRAFDVVISQELLRGSLNATVVGALRGVPVVTTMALPAVEYFRCRRARGQIGAFTAFGGEAAIRTLMFVNGHLSTRCMALGKYLQGIAGRYCPRTVPGGYYGVDTSFFTPVDDERRLELRHVFDLPADKFLIFLSSRISHEKDPETVLRAAAIARTRGLDAVLLNLSGGYRQFLQTADQMQLPDSRTWVLGREAVHPMRDVAGYFQTADVVAQGSLEEGLGLSTLEALACGTPVVATNVGGMAMHLPGFAQLTPLRDAEAMAEAFLWVAAHRDEARQQARQGREMVVAQWSKSKAFGDLADVLREVSHRSQAVTL